MACRRIDGGSRGECLRISRESLMVGPVRHPAARREAAAVISALGCVSVPRSSEKGELVTAPGGTGGS